MLGHNNFGFQLMCALNDRVKVSDLKPQQHAVSIRSIIRVPDSSVMMLHLKAVQLQDELAVPNQSLVFRTAMFTPATQ